MLRLFLVCTPAAVFDFVGVRDPDFRAVILAFGAGFPFTGFGFLSLFTGGFLTVLVAAFETGRRFKLGFMAGTGTAGDPELLSCLAGSLSLFLISGSGTEGSTLADADAAPGA
ncbi:MAG: hypothetical protein GY792_24700 [Gammaproteobacteria bacterium]|nr:hypothetical protein [Gammaproteobacteria bacterium]